MGGEGRTRGRSRKERKGRGGGEEGGRRENEGEARHGCWVVDAPGGRLSGMVTKPGGARFLEGVCPGGI